MKTQWTSDLGIERCSGWGSSDLFGNSSEPSGAMGSANEHRGMRMIDRNWAEAFAREWVDAWNAHDLERILSHYTDDFEMASPLIVERMGVAKRPVEGERGDSPLLGSGVGWGTRPQVRAPASDGWRELARHRLQECDGRAHGNRAHRVRRPRKGGAS